MNIDENEDETVDRMLVNHDEEFSVWPADQDGPNWRDPGKSGLKEQSPAHIKEFWTGMRLFSLKKRA